MKNIIVITSGKGGVGKSTVAASNARTFISSIKSSAKENAVRTTLFSISVVELLKTTPLKFKADNARISIAPNDKSDCTLPIFSLSFFFHSVPEFFNIYSEKKV